MSHSLMPSVGSSSATTATSQPRTVRTRGEASLFSATTDNSAGSGTTASGTTGPTVTASSNTNGGSSRGGTSSEPTTQVPFTPDFSGNPFLEAAYNLDLWQPLFDQQQYESRLETEAEMMIALEAMRFAML